VPLKAFSRDIEIYIKSRYGLICIETVEEERAEEVIRHIAFSMDMAFAKWCPATGLTMHYSNTPIDKTKDILSAVEELENVSFGGIWFCAGLHDGFEKSLNSQTIFNMVKKLAKSTGAIVMVGDNHNIPDRIKPYAAFVKLPLPGKVELHRMIKGVIRDLESKMKVHVDISQDDAERMVNNLSGLTFVEAQKVVTKAIVEDGMLTADDIARIVESKKNIIAKEGVLEYYSAPDGKAETMDTVAGLDSLKAWLEKRKKILTSPNEAKKYGLDFPKGILLLGVPGTGKSLSAKAVAREWGLPLLKMDTSALYNKFIGETEKNFKRAMTVAEKMSPVILWIDEIEKAFSQGDSTMDGGLSQRVLGTFLSWLQDRNGRVFIMATANDIAKLPPELLRKGRFDEIFFVDLPSAASREKIFEIQLKKRGQDHSGFDLRGLSMKSEGFSGAEIEQVVLSALYTAFSDGEKLTAAHIEKEITSTQPLSVTRAEDISAMRQWADGRAVKV